MTADIENLLLEHMKRFQAGQNRIERELETLVGRVGRTEIGIAGLRTDIAHVDEKVAALGLRVDHIDHRLERIEKRLDRVG